MASHELTFKLRNEADKVQPPSAPSNEQDLKKKTESFGQKMAVALRTKPLESATSNKKLEGTYTKQDDDDEVSKLVEVFNKKKCMKPRISVISTEDDDRSTDDDETKHIKYCRQNLKVGKHHSHHKSDRSLAILKDKAVKDFIQLSKSNPEIAPPEDETISFPNEHWKIDPNLVLHNGGCHCGAVRFSVYANPSPTIIECNCSICVKKQNRHFIVPMSQFRLVQGHNALTTYTFNTHKAKHTFCSICGVQAFYIPRSNSDGYGISPHCIDKGTLFLTGGKVEKFNGEHWEEAIKKSPHLEKYSKK